MPALPQMDDLVPANDRLRSRPPRISAHGRRSEAPAFAIDLQLPFPAGLAPTPQPLTAEPSPSDGAPASRRAGRDLDGGGGRSAGRRPDARLRTATTGTATSGTFADYLPDIREERRRARAKRLGSYFPTRVGNTRVLCVKSELHLNQDGVRTAAGKATLPVKRLLSPDDR